MNGGDNVAAATVRMQVSIKELYDIACPSCKAKIRKLVKAKVTDDLVTSILGDNQKKEVSATDRTE
jgi:DNA-directed RNA polymerase subunit RPC12/RpoP